jgi:hypothetical protein
MSSKPFPVIFHPVNSLTLFSCAYERGNTTSRDALVFIEGLTSRPHTTPQLGTLIEALERHNELSYSFGEFWMRSSYTGFGYSSLANNVEDISALVTYLRGLGKEKIVLLGRSTGTAILDHISHADPTVDRLSSHADLHQIKSQVSGS